MGINITVGGRGVGKESKSYKLRYTLILTIMKKFIQLKNYLISINANFGSAKTSDQTKKTPLSLRLKIQAIKWFIKLFIYSFMIPYKIIRFLYLEFSVFVVCSIEFICYIIHLLIRLMTPSTEKCINPDKLGYIPDHVAGAVIYDIIAWWVCTFLTKFLGKPILMPLRQYIHSLSAYLIPFGELLVVIEIQLKEIIELL